MPGSVGGSIWMNARCYGRSISDLLCAVEVIEESGDLKMLRFGPEDFAYKQSPFQARRCIILRGFFALKPGEPTAIEALMLEHEADRTRKGHFTYPSAGSTFKNNRAWSESSGQIIDSLGFRGYRVGEAMVSKKHANIIVNTGEARAADFLKIVERIEEVVQKHLGYTLEREILTVGEW